MEKAQEALRMLRAHGLSADLHPGNVISVNGRAFAYRELRASPTKHDVERVLLSEEAVLVAPGTVTPSLRAIALEDQRVAVVASDTIIVDRHLYPSASTQPSPPNASPGPKPYARFAVARTILAPAHTGFTQQDLALRAGVTQSAVHKALASTLLVDLVTRGRGSIAVHDDSRGKLFDRILDQYPGPGGLVTYWWKDDSISQQARELSMMGTTLRSGDPVADEISPWRKPEHAVIYSTEALALQTRGYALASPNDYSLMLIYPEDPYLFKTSSQWLRPGATDPVIAAFDIRRTARLGDESEGVERLRRSAIEGR